MTFVRAASILLASLTTFACVIDGANDDGDSAEPCPATGDPLLPSVARVQPVYTDGCEDATWASDVEANVAWTIELENGAQSISMVVVPSADGVVAISGRTARWVTGTGELVNQRDLGSTVSWNRVQGSTNGQLVVSGATGAAPFYRVLDANGAQVWLRLLESGFGTPSVWRDGGDVLVGVIDFTDDQVLRVQRWALTGALKGELVLPAYSDAFVRDGNGRYAVMWGSTLQVFDSDGTPLGEVAVGIGEYPSVYQIVGAEDGFYAAGGELDAFVARVTVDNGVAVDWTYTIGDAASEWEYAQGLAALPGGGVVVVGGENKIRVTWPESPLITMTQPFVLALDAEGQPIWGERIAASGWAMAVGIGTEGEVYVAGTAQAGPPGDGGGTSWASWLRRYDPQ